MRVDQQTNEDILKKALTAKKCKADKLGNAGKFSVAQTRVIYIAKMILSGLKRYEILEHCTNPENVDWEVSVHTIDSYLKKAHALIRENDKEDYMLLRTETRQRLDFLYQSCMISRDYKTALRALEVKAEIFGLKREKVSENVIYVNAPVFPDEDGIEVEAKVTIVE